MDLFTATEKAEIASLQDDVFDTFKEKIVIFQTPLETYVATTNTNFNFAFEDQQPLNNVTYTIVSGQFDATIEYVDQQDNQQLNKIDNSRITTTDGYVRICVSGDANNYLKDAKNITFDGDSFVIVSDKRPRGIFVRKYFDYFLQKPEKAP